MNNKTPCTDEYLRQVYEDAPLLKSINECYKDLSLYEYLEFLKQEYIDNTERRIDPVIERSIRDYAVNLIGEDDANCCIEVLSRTNLFHTANHHIVNFHTMTFQGNLLYEQLINMSMDSYVIPFLSCSSISMSNAFYPRGIIVYDTEDGYECDVPIFPYKMRKVVVSQAKPYTYDMLSQATKTIKRHVASGRISEESFKSAIDIIDNIYSDANVLNCNSYGQQITIINRVLSDRYLTDRSSRHIFLELEEISMRIICHDLADDNSLLCQMLYNGNILSRIRDNLDGVSGCWTRDYSGTFLFWGVDDRGRLYRLQGEFDRQDKIESIRLCGTDLTGCVHQHVLDRDSLARALRSYRLIPGLFITFFVLGIARDVNLIGGCYQGDYVGKMCRGVHKAWHEAVVDIDDDTMNWMEGLDKKSFPYLCGPLYMFHTNRTSYHPMGSVEMVSSRMTTSEYIRKLEIGFVDAQKLGLYCFYPDSIPPSSRADKWWERIYGEMLH